MSVLAVGFKPNIQFKLKLVFNGYSSSYEDFWTWGFKNLIYNQASAKEIPPPGDFYSV